MSGFGVSTSTGGCIGTRTDIVRFVDRSVFRNARASLRECQAIMELKQIDDPELKLLANQLGAILYTLSRRSPPADRTKTDAGADTGADAETETTN